MTDSKRKLHISNVLFTVAVPMTVFIIMEVLDIIFTGTHVISSSVDLITLMRNLATSYCFALALNCNVSMGRMDLSTGAQMYLACIVGGNLALHLAGIMGDTAGSLLILVISIILGGLAGMVVGLFYVKLRILPMVLGLGVALVYESISFSVNSNQGLILYGKAGILAQLWFILLVVLIVMVVMTYLFRYSSFGFERSAIQGNQRLAYDVGINIYKNAVICYMLAGALVSVSGVFITVYETRLVPVLGMNSNSYVFSNLFPMAIGLWLARKSNPVVGVLVGALTVQILVMGLSKFSIIGMSSYMQTCIKYSCWLFFMIYRMNEYKFAHIKNKRARIAEAKKVFAGMAA